MGLQRHNWLEIGNLGELRFSIWRTDVAFLHFSSMWLVQLRLVLVISPQSLQDAKHRIELWCRLRPLEGAYGDNLASLASPWCRASRAYLPVVHEGASTCKTSTAPAITPPRPRLAPPLYGRDSPQLARPRQASLWLRQGCAS